MSSLRLVLVLALLAALGGLLALPALLDGSPEVEIEPIEVTAPAGGVERAREAGEQRSKGTADRQRGPRSRQAPSHSSGATAAPTEAPLAAPEPPPAEPPIAPPADPGGDDDDDDDDGAD